MSILSNTFSWSLSAANDFDECRRKRYWAKYAMWNGWKEQAPELQRTAYRLTKMENRFTIQGNAVERAVMWALRQQQAGKPVAAEETYTATAKPFLNRCWSESKNGLWKTNPKKHCCLHEHYYPTHHRHPEAEMTAQMITQVKQCIANFIAKTLPRLEGIRPEQEIAVATVETGDPESFQFEDVKIYAIPDYAYRQGEELHIHDWKSGGPRESHRSQMALYGLWANRKHKAPPGRIQAHLEYLVSGQVQSASLTENDFEHIAALISGSVAEMSEYLVDGDRRRNEPLPQVDWELAADAEICRTCNFYELCRPEIEAK